MSYTFASILCIRRGIFDLEMKIIDLALLSLAENAKCVREMYILSLKKISLGLTSLIGNNFN